MVFAICVKKVNKKQEIYDKASVKEKLGSIGIDGWNGINACADESIGA